MSLKGLEAFARLRRPCFHLVIAIAATTRKGGPIRRPRYCQHRSTRGCHEVRNGLTIKQVAFPHACRHCTLLSPDHFTTTVASNGRSKVTGDRSVDVGIAVPPATPMHKTEKRGWGAHSWPRRVCLHWPSSGLHMRTVLSLLPDARRLPSGLQATDLTVSLPIPLHM